MKTISIVTPPDKPGVAVLPPVLYGGVLLIVLVLNYFWPLRITRPSVAAPLGLVVVLAALGLVFLGQNNDARSWDEYQSTKARHDFG